MRRDVSLGKEQDKGERDAWHYCHDLEAMVFKSFLQITDREIKNYMFGIKFFSEKQAF